MEDINRKFIIASACRTCCHINVVNDAMAEAHYGGVPAEIQAQVLRRLDAPLRAEVVAFAREYGVSIADDYSIEQGEQ